MYTYRHVYKVKSREIYIKSKLEYVMKRRVSKAASVFMQKSGNFCIWAIQCPTPKITCGAPGLRVISTVPRRERGNDVLEPCVEQKAKPIGQGDSN